MTAKFPFGLPLDSNDVQTSRSGQFSPIGIPCPADKSDLDWTMFIAAIASNNTLRDGLISFLHAYASPNLDSQPFAVVYNPQDGSQISGVSRLNSS